MPETNPLSSWTIPTSFALGDAAARIQKVRRDYEQWFQAEPVKAFGVSLGVGIFLGWLVKRR